MSEPTSSARARRARAATPDIAPHRPALRDYLTRFLPEAEVEDAVQSVLEQALTRQGRYRADESPRVWLLGIARELVEARAARPPPPVSPPLELTVDEGPEVALAHRQQQGRLLTALDGLSLDEKLTLLIRYVDEIPGPQAAGLLGISHAAFRQRLSRARRSLSERLQQKGGGVGEDTAAIEAWRAALHPSGSRD